ncbi:MAG: hypothetical protein IID05_01215 [Gemmatimonadetes bacterium]|nr:hypothetical protein [Gemmatimonadota bacterium]
MANWEQAFSIRRQTTGRKLLNKVAKQGAFFWWIRQGKIVYGMIANSYSSSDATLNQDDFKDKSFQIGTTGLDGIINDITVRYNSVSGQTTKSTFASVAVSKTRYNYNSKTEFIADFIKETTPAASLRDYLKDNFNDIKSTPSGVLINPKYFNLEIGDIVQFDNANMPMDVFGVAWTNYYFMVIENRWRSSKEKQMQFIQVSPK